MDAEGRETMSIINLSAETKVIGGIGIVTLVILIGGVFLLSSQDKAASSIPPERIVSNNGLHWHPRLEIYIKGKKQEIPTGIGLTGSIHQEMHTHDEDAKDGVIHMEMKGIVTKDETKLFNFFKIWGKEFNSTQIFDKKNSKEGKVMMIVNGQESKVFENYQMQEGDIIEIRYE